MSTKAKSLRDATSITDLISDEDRNALERVGSLMSRIIPFVNAHRGCCDIYDPEKVALAQTARQVCNELGGAWDHVQTGQEVERATPIMFLMDLELSA